MREIETALLLCFKSYNIGMDNISCHLESFIRLSSAVFNIALVSAMIVFSIIFIKKLYDDFEPEENEKEKI